MQRTLITNMAKIIQDKTLTDIANAIRSKTNSTDTMKPSDMPSKINSITTGITPTGDITLTDNNLYYNVEKYKRAIAKIPEATYFKQLFENTLEDFSYEGTDYKASVFTNHTGLKTVNAPYIWQLPINAFYMCSNLTSVYLPNLAGTIGTNVFNGCSSLRQFIQPKAECYYDTGYHFYSCTLINKIDIYPASSSWLMQSFTSCSNLKTLIIRGTNLPSIDASSLTGTPIESGTGYIYVLQEMLDTYKSATNWSTYADQFRAIEDYPDICAIPEEYQ